MAFGTKGTLVAGVLAALGEQVPGVSEVKIDFEHKIATVHLDTDKANASMLTKATTDAGFPSTVRK